MIDGLTNSAVRNARLLSLKAAARHKDCCPCSARKTRQMTLTACAAVPVMYVRTADRSPGLARCSGAQSTLQTANEVVCLEWLPEEANCATGKSLPFETRLMTRCNHYHWQGAFRRREVLFKFDTAHAWHLNVRDDAGEVFDLTAL